MKWFAASVAAALVAAACGGKTPAPKPPDDSADGDPYADRNGRFVDDDDSQDDDDDDGVVIQSDRGSLRPADIQAGIAPHQDALSHCYHDNVRKMKFVGGKVEMKWRVARDGSVVHVQMLDSDLGSWTVERCLLDVGRGMQFAEPRGGEAEFTMPLEFASGRSVAWWDEERAEAEVSEVVGELADCEGDPANVWVTLYLAARGEVKSVGFASREPEPLPDTWAECAATKALAWQLTDPRGRVAKLGFRYNPR